jgi:hypothetical protein
MTRIRSNFMPSKRIRSRLAVCALSAFLLLALSAGSSGAARRTRLFGENLGRNARSAAQEKSCRYRIPLLYLSEVIPALPFLKPEGVALAIQMMVSINPSAATMRPQDLTDAALVQELINEGGCSF